MRENEAVDRPHLINTVCNILKCKKNLNDNDNDDGDDNKDQNSFYN